MPFADYKNFKDCVSKNQSKSDPEAYCATIMRATEATEASDPSTKKREAYAKKGVALSDGSFPIPDVSHLKAAIKAFGRAKNKAAAKRHIIKRARALGRTDLLPEDWRGSTKEGVETDEHEQVHGITDISEIEEIVFEDVNDRMMARVRILQAGKSKNNRIYRPSAVKEAVDKGLFDGVRMFIDHDDKKVPIKRKLREMVSAIESTSWDEPSKSLDAHVEFFDKEFYDFAQRAKKHMGSSINALVMGDRYRRPDGVMEEDIKSITHPRSVDWVIYPAAGGEILAFESEAGDNDNEEEQVDWDAVTLDEVKKNAPHIVTEMEEELKPPPPPQDDADKGEETLTRAEVALIVQESLEGYISTQEESKKKRVAVADRVRAKMQTSGLPEKTRVRVTAQFEATEDFDEAAVQKAIDSAKEELAAAGAGPRISGNGPSSGSTSTGPKAFSVRESVESAFGIKAGSTKSDDSKEGAK